MTRPMTAEFIVGAIQRGVHGPDLRRSSLNTIHRGQRAVHSPARKPALRTSKLVSGKERKIPALSKGELVQAH